MVNDLGNYELFLKMNNNLDILLKSTKLKADEKLFFDFIYDFKTLLYDTINKQLEPYKDIPENETLIRKYCKYVAKKLLPICNDKILVLKKEFAREDLVNHDYIKQLLEKWLMLEDDLYALASFRSLKMFAYYIERGNSKKVWAKTMNIFNNYFYYANEMILNDKIDLIRASYFPGAGKTYAGNLTCAYWFGYDLQMTILRITYSDDLAKSFTKQIQNIMTSDQYKKVFPKFNKEPNEIFKVSNATEIWINGSSNANFYATTRDGQATGKRAKLIMIDDVTKGRKEAYNVDIQNQIVNMYDTDWSTRGDDDNQKMIMLGTMWSRFDLLNVIQQRDEANGSLTDDEMFKYTKLNYDKTCVYIGVPILDYDTDESTCPLRYSTEKMRKRREQTKDKALFNAVYQQRPEEPEELIFAYRRLQTYNTGNFPKQILEGDFECRAFIDPNRTGFDYFVCAFYKRYRIPQANKNDLYSKWYFVDCICRRKTYKMLKDDLIQKIKNNKVSKLGIEINTSNELPELIKDELSKAGYHKIKIEEEFSTEKKEVKIQSLQQEILEEIIYPAKGLFAEGSEMADAMDMLTTYSVDKKNDHDDFPDCNSMFVKQNLVDNDGGKFEILSSYFRL